MKIYLIQIKQFFNIHSLQNMIKVNILKFFAIS